MEIAIIDKDSNQIRSSPLGQEKSREIRPEGKTSPIGGGNLWSERYRRENATEGIFCSKSAIWESIFSDSATEVCSGCDSCNLRAHYILSWQQNLATSSLYMAHIWKSERCKSKGNCAGFHPGSRKSLRQGKDCGGHIPARRVIARCWRDEE